MRLLVLMLTVALIGACSTSDPGEGCADVVGVELEVEPDGRFTIAVSVRSADTGWDKYADVWEVVGPDGEVLATRTLAHPHVDEQPFTRSLSGVAIPESAPFVTVRARDSIEGFCGETVEVSR
jgi:hypothetical protein